MSFNSDTYYANKYSRMAWANLARAREIKQWIANGEYVSEFEASRIETFARLALIDMRLSINSRQLAKLRSRR
ncbi:hypothetical protein RFM23_05500 [Mesorhizobium abyssinicae]|uniref:Uncharacterized protein n=1 Tax=Mesorhizobium abyssinicae TaxID=1209958 RepID=A0ABU5AII5_9HYPH|nr:hypothetical protein [Mesorhizobium abyssinicae]MDX8537078.1 hypothetical protein [Mesorhizobium abyssinicae]